MSLLASWNDDQPFDALDAAIMAVAALYQEVASIMTIDDIIDGAIGREGGYSNHPADRGGETMWGVTIAVARANGYTGDMRAMPRDRAKRIYRIQYVERPGFDQVAQRYPRVGEELVDTGINMGPAVAAMMLQRALNALNRQGKDYPDIAADGAIGPGTLAALDGYKRTRGAAGEAVLVKALDCLQGERYLDIAEKRPANEAFVYGWLANRVGQS